ncbi:HpcH/HpaI aldolase/citrate lyase family protein [Pollutimonas nitritireducens]|nr:CoA ester lyase [Pollutimonas nitritireducens]
MKRSLRSVLYVPGINEKAMRKAATLPVDAIVLDLEDSVLHERKSEARDTLSRFLTANRSGFHGKYVVVRVNGRDTEFWDDDLDMVTPARPDAVLLPKVIDPDIPRNAREKLNKGGSESTAIWCMIENPLGILKLESIVENGRADGVECLVLGTNDLIKDSDIDPGEGRKNLIPWLAHVTLVAKSFNIQVIDGVLNNIHDLDALKAESEVAKAMGMSGKTIIHPLQVETVNRCFSPSVEELDHWRRIVHAYSLPENVGKGVINLDGVMVERLHLEIANRQLRDYGSDV